MSYWYSVESPRRDASTEYQQHMFSSGNKKHIRYTLSGANTGGSFTVDDSNSFFSPYKIIPIAQEGIWIQCFEWQDTERKNFRDLITKTCLFKYTENFTTKKLKIFR